MIQEENNNAAQPHKLFAFEMIFCSHKVAIQILRIDVLALLDDFEGGPLDGRR